MYEDSQVNCNKISLGEGTCCKLTKCNTFCLVHLTLSVLLYMKGTCKLFIFPRQSLSDTWLVITWGENWQVCMRWWSWNNLFNIFTEFWAGHCKFNTSLNCLLNMSKAYTIRKTIGYIICNFVSEFGVNRIKYHFQVWQNERTLSNQR